MVLKLNGRPASPDEDIVVNDDASGGLQERLFRVLGEEVLIDLIDVRRPRP